MLHAGVCQWQARQNRDAVIAFHAEDMLMLIALRGERRARKSFIDRLGFLQADDVRLVLVDQPFDKPCAGARN